MILTNFEGLNFTVMLTPNGVDGCRRCHFCGNEACERSQKILGNCRGGRKLYFVWIADKKNHMEKPAFQPIIIDKIDGIG